jgi:predicted GNAT family acetyltransferase
VADQVIWPQTFIESECATLGVEVRDNPDAARYEIREDGELAGFLAYRLKTNRITLVHTEIDTARRGRGLASQIARAALDDARTRRLTVVPHCSFVARFIRQHAEDYLPLVAPSLRDLLVQADPID